MFPSECKALNHLITSVQHGLKTCQSNNLHISYISQGRYLPLLRYHLVQLAHSILDSTCYFYAPDCHYITIGFVNQLIGAVIFIYGNLVIIKTLRFAVLSMQLRKNIKPPRRYEEYQQPNDDDVEKEVFHSPPKPSTRAAYRGKIIEFDPSLPPAVFPTTDLWWSGKADVKGSSASRPNSSIAVPQTSDPRKSQTNSQVPASQKQRTKPTNPPQSILHSIMPQSRSPPKYIAYRCQSPDLLKDLPTEVEEVDDGIWSNGQANPIYVDNLKIMEKLGARTNDDLELLEMETSDEEDRLQNSKSVQKVRLRSPMVCNIINQEF